MSKELAGPQEIIDAVFSAKNRDEVVPLYVTAITDGERWVWGVLNEQIIRRWSPAALRYVKKRAWSRVAEIRGATR